MKKYYFFFVGLVFIGSFFIFNNLANAGSSPDGTLCKSNEECASGHCTLNPNVCCRKGKACCLIDTWCQNKVAWDYICGPDYYCIPKSGSSTSKTKSEICQSQKICADCLAHQGDTCMWSLCLNKCVATVDIDYSYCFEWARSTDQCGPPESCGNNKCGGNENCSSCPVDCGKCKQKDGASCTVNNDCQSNLCIEKFCRPKGYTWCGDNTCQSNEGCDCADCKNDKRCRPKGLGESCKKSSECESTYCQDGLCAKKEYLENYLQEYFALAPKIEKLNKKIYTPPLKAEFSPAEMHTAIFNLVKNNYQGTENEAKAVALLKNAIAVEKLGLAVYEAENETAGILAESSWASFKTYLLYRVQEIIASALQNISNATQAELEESQNKYIQISNELLKDIHHLENIELILKKVGIVDRARISDLKDAINQSFEQAKGSPKRYLDNLESIVKSKYIDFYKEAFIQNFEEAISNQIVYYQVGIYHHNEFVGYIQNSDLPYREYQVKINEILNEIRVQKEFILGGNNIFDKGIKLNQALIKTTDELGILIDQAITLSVLADKGASLAGKKTNFEEVASSVQFFSDNLKTALNAAEQTLDLTGKFTESLFGTYQEAKIYSIFFNAYNDWCEKTLGGCATLLRIPGTNVNIRGDWLYKISRPLGAAIDEVVIKSGTLAQKLGDQAEVLAGYAKELVSKTLNQTQTTIKQGIKKTQAFMVSATVVAVQTGQKVTTSAKETVKKGIETTQGYTKSAAARLTAYCLWGLGKVIGQAPLTEKDYFIETVQAEENPVIEFAIISPSGIRYPGIVLPDGSGSYVVIENPEEGKWQTEVIGKEVRGEEPIKIALNVEEILPGEKIEKLSTIEETKGLKWSVQVVVIAMIIIIGIALVSGFYFYHRRKKER